MQTKFEQVIAIDFDGTCVTHEFPEVGQDIGAVPVIKRLVEAGHKIIVWTMRSGKYLKQATNWFEQNKIPLFGVNHNIEQDSWTDSPKAYANLYIDDMALGAPLRSTISSEESDIELVFNKPFIDWKRVENELEFQGYLPCTPDKYKKEYSDKIAVLERDIKMDKFGDIKFPNKTSLIRFIMRVYSLGLKEAKEYCDNNSIYNWNEFRNVKQ